MSLKHRRLADLPSHESRNRDSTKVSGNHNSIAVSDVIASLAVEEKHSSMPPKRSAKKLAKDHDLEESDIRQVREAFDLIAGSNSVISISAVRSALSALGLDVTQQETRSINSHLTAMVADKDEDGVTFEMFLEVVAVKMSDRDKTSEVDRAFELFDPNNTGRITVHDLRRIAKMLGENIKDEELIDMLQEAGNGNGIDKAQFEEVMGRAGIW